uniref:(northern house mosquito) hypothetical protein n=1 Tax=Culex pipiens TaxID=7175 RepID=A0A8D7ZW93_CULPI
MLPSPLVPNLALFRLVDRRMTCAISHSGRRGRLQLHKVTCVEPTTRRRRRRHRPRRRLRIRRARRFRVRSGAVHVNVHGTGLLTTSAASAVPLAGPLRLQRIARGDDVRRRREGRLSRQGVVLLRWRDLRDLHAQIISTGAHQLV